MHRRQFLALTAATALTPFAVEAETAVFDPTPQEVRIKKDFAPGQILVLPRSYYLYWVTEERKAIRYGVGVGKAGLEFTGQATIDVKKEWPTWRPTNDMIKRDPKAYARFKDNEYIMPGGPKKPARGPGALPVPERSGHVFFASTARHSRNLLGHPSRTGVFA